MPQQIAHFDALDSGVAMIEVQDKWIRFTTVAAWMIDQVLNQSALVLSSVQIVIATGICDIRRFVALVVLAIPRALAFAAERVQAAQRAILEVEGSIWLELAAMAAGFLTRPLEHATV